MSMSFWRRPILLLDHRFMSMFWTVILLLSLATPAASSSSSSSSAAADPTKIETFDPNMTEYWFDAIVDHFNFRPTAKATFPLRYLVNDQYYHNSNCHDNNENPVIFYAGNEADIWKFANNSGFLWEAAKSLNAMIVFAEHRYYGKSFPLASSSDSDDYSSSLSSQNISYLTVEQAMADFNSLQGHIRQEYNMTRNAAFIVTGGSYGGNLALWLRLKNPNLWAGAIASSATPLKHKLRQSNAFYKIVADVYGNVSSVCPDKIRQGWKELYDNIKTLKGRAKIKQELNLCHIPKKKHDDKNKKETTKGKTPGPYGDADDQHQQSSSSSYHHIANQIYGYISNALETMVQYGYPYSTEFYNPVPGYPFKVACEGMLNETSRLGALRAAANVYYNYTGQAGPCFDWFSSSSKSWMDDDDDDDDEHQHETTNSSNNKKKDKKQVTILHDEGQSFWNRMGQLHFVSDTTDDNDYYYDDGTNNKDDKNHVVVEKDLTGIAWNYQCCTEVYQPMPTDGITDFQLPHKPNQTKYFEKCQRRWDGVMPRPNWEEMTFWSDNIQAGSNIFLSSGQLDPWRAAGIQNVPSKGSRSTRDDESDIIVRIIENGAHHLDLRSSNPLDPPSVVQVRREELEAMRRWIRQWRELYPFSLSVDFGVEAE